MEVAAQEYGITDIIMNIFVRQIDNKTQVSAVDTVYALSSILESPKNLAKKSDPLLTAKEEQKKQAESESRVGSIFQHSSVG
jgi:hypothetical protein